MGRLKEPIMQGFGRFFNGADTNYSATACSAVCPKGRDGLANL